MSADFIRWICRVCAVVATAVAALAHAGVVTDGTVGPCFLSPDESGISAHADAGDGGRTTIVADCLPRSGSIVDASAAPASTGGMVVESTPKVDLSGGLVVLEGALLDAASQLRERCASRDDIGASRCTGVGRGGLPPSPDGPLAAAYPTGFGAPGLALLAQRGEEEHSVERAIWPAVAGLAP